MAEVAIRYDRFLPEHAPCVVPFHMENLGGKLCAMGASSVRRFYDAALRMEGVFGWVAFHEARLAGFVFGSLWGGNLASRVLRQDLPGWMLEGLRGALTHPLDFLRAAGEMLKGSGGHDRTRNPELHFIAVAPRYRGLRIGVELLERFSGTLKEHGRTGFELSVERENTSAIGFYESRGGTAIYDYGAAERHYRRFYFEGR